MNTSLARPVLLLLAALLGGTGAITCSAAGGKSTERTELGRPDLENIRLRTTDPESPLYYGKLLDKFMRNDTTMTSEEFQAFYYGTLFQEDYDPYREAVNQALLAELGPIYAKEKRTRADREKMLDYAEQVLRDNPVDLRQLTNKIYVLEQNRKNDLARIWQYKLNHLLLVIAASGEGSSKESAWIVVYPQHEYDFLNLRGSTAVSNRFDPPGFDYIEASHKGGEPTGYYFDISELLKQYFVKHPTELERTPPGGQGADE